MLVTGENIFQTIWTILRHPYQKYILIFGQTFIEYLHDEITWGKVL